jgi:hypothetical protein
MPGPTLLDGSVCFTEGASDVVQFFDVGVGLHYGALILRAVQAVCAPAIPAIAR